MGGWVGWFHLLLDSLVNITIWSLMHLIASMPSLYTFNVVTMNLQTLTSFILKLRMYPDRISAQDEPLMEHVKGLSEFTDMTHKLQTLLEEELNTG